MIRHTPDPVPELGVGDHVVAVVHLGGFFRPSVRRGTPGVVTARTTDGTVHVAFGTGHALKLDPADVTVPGPQDPRWP